MHIFVLILNSPLSRVRKLLILVYRFVYKSVNFTCELIDLLIYRNYRKVKLEKPVFIIGHPRSGTTFLHRFILDNVVQFRGSILWKLIFQSIFPQNILKPIVKSLNRKVSGRMYNPAIHKTSLMHAETDDIALFFKSFKGLFSWLYFRAFNVYENDKELRQELIEYCQIKRTISLIDDLNKKRLFVKNNRGARMISKSFSLLLGFDEIINYFNDAKIIIMLRNPMESIPSSMSLATNLIETIYKGRLDKTKMDNYYKNIYKASLFFYEILHEKIQKINKTDSRFFVLSYNDLKSDFVNVFSKLASFLEIDDDVNLKNNILQQSRKQSNYRSKHTYSLGDFGLYKEKIMSDFKFIFDNYQFD